MSIHKVQALVTSLQTLAPHVLPQEATTPPELAARLMVELQAVAEMVADNETARAKRERDMADAAARAADFFDRARDDDDNEPPA